MQVLFVCSGNHNNGVNIIIENQGISLIDEGIGVEYFTIEGKGIKSYSRNIFKLRQHLRKNSYEIIHAHYSFSAFVTTLAGGRPIVVSLMGSDIYSSIFWKELIRFFSRFVWKSVILKSQEMAEHIRVLKPHIIPNGVNLERFTPLNQQDARNELGLDKLYKYVLFVADPKRPEKNFSLAESALREMKVDNVKLLVVSNLPNSVMPLYYNAANVLLLTSLYEGSPNVIKEALACNLPIVSTDVGDVKELIFPVKGCIISKSNPETLALNISRVLELGIRSNGRERIKSLKLESGSIAKRLIKLYEVTV